MSVRSEPVVVFHTGDEALADAAGAPLYRKWGLSHEGAGGDSEAVTRAEDAVRVAVLRACVENNHWFRPD